MFKCSNSLRVKLQNLHLFKKKKRERVDVLPTVGSGSWTALFSLERKACFILDANNGVCGAGHSVQRADFSLLTISGQELLLAEGGGHTQKQHSLIWGSSWNWSCGGLTSVILIVLSAVHLQFQARFVPISLRPVLGTVAAYVTATVWSSCSERLPPSGGVSVSARQLTAYGSEY